MKRLSSILGNEGTLFLSHSPLKTLALFCFYGYKTYIALPLSWTDFIPKTFVTPVFCLCQFCTECRRSWDNVLKFRHMFTKSQPKPIFRILTVCWLIQALM